MTDSDQEVLDFLKTLQGMEGISDGDIEEMASYLGTDASSMGISEEASQGDLMKEINKLSTKEELSEDETSDVRALIAKMNLPGKMKLAMFGNATCRSILINEGNKIIQLAVLKNPKLQDKEVDAYSRNPNLSKHVLREISANRQWTRPYHIKLNLVTNPKTPIDVATKWLRFVRLPDMKKIARSKDVPKAVVIQAKKRLEIMEKKK